MALPSWRPMTSSFCSRNRLSRTTVCFFPESSSITIFIRERLQEPYDTTKELPRLRCPLAECYPSASHARAQGRLACPAGRRQGSRRRADGRRDLQEVP